MPDAPNEKLTPLALEAVSHLLEVLETSRRSLAETSRRSFEAVSAYVGAAPAAAPSAADACSAAAAVDAAGSEAPAAAAAAEEEAPAAADDEEASAADDDEEAPAAAADTNEAEPPTAAEIAVNAAADAEIADIVPRDPTPPGSCKLSGDGLHTAVAGQSVTFTIETMDPASGQRQHNKTDKFVVLLSGAGSVRPRIFDEGDGRYTVEYRCPSSGKYRLSVMSQSRHLPGSPHALTVKSGGSLKDWKAKQAKEAADMRERKKQKENERKAPVEKRAPSPRINPQEQLEKAYEQLLAGIANNRTEKPSKKEKAAAKRDRAGTRAGPSSPSADAGAAAAASVAAAAPAPSCSSIYDSATQGSGGEALDAYRALYCAGPSADAGAAATASVAAAAHVASFSSIYDYSATHGSGGGALDAYHAMYCA